MIINHINFNSMHHDKFHFISNLIQLLSISILFPLQAIQKCQCLMLLTLYMGKLNSWCTCGPNIFHFRENSSKIGWHQACPLLNSWSEEFHASKKYLIRHWTVIFFLISQIVRVEWDVFGVRTEHPGEWVRHARPDQCVPFELFYLRGLQ